jgi:hypothetical protein
MHISNLVSANHTISVNVLDISKNKHWLLTRIYGSQDDLGKKMFIRELKHLKQTSNLVSANHTISVNVLDISRNKHWLLTRIYGPQDDLGKKMFIRELKHLKQTAMTKWLIIGDFNLFYKVPSKNNGRLN